MTKNKRGILVTVRYDDFQKTMGAENALSKFNGAFSHVAGVGHDHSGEGQGGIINGSSIVGSVSHALISADATNLTGTINNQPLSSIFESDGKTAKNATNVSSTIGGKSLDSIFESNGTTVKNCTTASNSTKLNNLNSNYYQKFYMPSENILLEKVQEQDITDTTFIGPTTYTAAVMSIYHPGLYNLSFDIKIDDGTQPPSSDNYFEVYWNGILLWSEDEIDNGAYVKKSKNILINPGKITIKLSITGGTYNTMYIRNIRLKGTPSEVPSFSIT
jgi:hypothetical protein